MNIIAHAPQLVGKLEQPLLYWEGDLHPTRPTLIYHPVLSLLHTPGEGFKKLYGLNRPEAAAICRLTNVAFMDGQLQRCNW